MVLKDGETINNKYSIVRKVNDGGMSVVYLALDLNLNKYWAIKEITKQRTAEGLREYKALMIESDILKKLNHPFLPRIVDIINDDSRVFIVMDYLEGHNLRDVLRTESNLSEEKTVKIGKQLANVLLYLHSQDPKIIYRDMKPSNVMLQPDGNIKLFDFGISREVTEDYNPDATQALGTKHYASPEQFAYPPQFDERSDIFSLGMTLYTLVTGHRIDVSPQKIRPITGWFPDLSKGLEHIISKATMQDPEDRYQSVSEMLYDLSNYKKLDISYQNNLKKKLYITLGVGFSSIILLFTTIGLYTSYSNQMKDEYNSIIQKSEIVKDTSILQRAFELEPYNVEAYEKALDLYKEDSIFTKEEENEFLSILNNNLIKLQENKDYGELAFQIGVLYWFYYDTEDQSENYISSIKWFEDSIKYGSKDSKTANLYSEIGKFYRDIALSVKEATDSGLYNQYWNRVNDSLSLKYPNDLTNLQLVTLVYDSILNYGIPMASDGVSKASMLEGYSKATDLLEKVNPSSEKAIEMKKELENNKIKVKDQISVVFK